MLLLRCQFYFMLNRDRSCGYLVKFQIKTPTCTNSHVRLANSSPKMFAFSTKQKRIRGLSILEQTELKNEPWFQIGVPREISLEVLRRKNPGEFLVRESSTKPGCFALSLRAPPPAPKVVHYLGEILKFRFSLPIPCCAYFNLSIVFLYLYMLIMNECGFLFCI